MRVFRTFLARLRRNRRGNVTILMGAGMLMLIGAAALGVDVGAIYLETRRLQGIADLAALSAAGSSGTGEAQARATIAANPGGNASLAGVEPGRYTADVSVDAAQRFQPGAGSPNAVRVTVAQDVPLFFGQLLTGKRTTRVTVRATASRSNMAAFSIGSRLAGVNGGLPGTLLSALAGTELNLSVMDYNALAGADIDLLAFSDALRTTARLDAATFADTLRASVTLPQILEAMALAAPPQSRAALRALALRVPGTRVRLDALIDPGPLAGVSRADPANRIGVDSYAMLRELLTLANGNRQVTLDLGVTVPGLTSTNLRLAIGERPANSPWLAISMNNSVIVRTAQTRLYFDTRIGGAATLGLISLRLPIFIELAQAEASLASITCGAPSQRSVSLRVTPAVGQISVADIDPAAFDNFKTPLVTRPALIARALIAEISGQATVHLGGVTPQTVSFSADDISSGRTRIVSTADLTQGIAASLLGSIDLRVTALGLGLNVGTLLAPVGQALGVIAPALDGLLDQVTGLLGVRVGQAKVRVNGVRCGTSILVG